MPTLVDSVARAGDGGGKLGVKVSGEQTIGRAHGGGQKQVLNLGKDNCRSKITMEVRDKYGKESRNGRRSWLQKGEINGKAFDAEAMGYEEDMS